MTHFPISGYPRPSANADFFIQDLGTAAFYGLEFIDTSEDLIIPNQNLSCKPAILIEGSTMVIDYGDCGANSDKDFIDIAFTSMTAGSGFTLTNAIYNDVVNSYSADLAASCTLNTYTNYKILSTYSAIGSTTEIDYYLSRNFETVPQISTSTGLTSGITANQIINYATSNDTSFIALNFSAGDYLDFSTSSNTGRYVIDGITSDDFSREIITLTVGSPRVVPEDLKGTEVIVGHKRKTYLFDNNPFNLNGTIIHRVTTEAIGGKNYFAIDGTIQENLTLFRGNMYVFVEDSYPEHILGFSTTPDGIHAGGLSFADVGFYSILDSSLNKRIYFIVPNNNTPNQLYYYCTLHPGMGGAMMIAGNYSYGNNIPALTTNITTSATGGAVASSAYG